MKLIINILTVLMLFGAVATPDYSYAQVKDSKVKKWVRKGRKAYRKGEYWKAKSYYDKVVEADSPKPQYWLETGMVYYDSQVEREKSMIYFERALELSVEDTIPEIFYYLGKAYHFAGEYEMAIDNYNIFLNNVQNNKKGMALRQEVIREIEICNNGIDLREQDNGRKVTISNMGEVVNSDYPDYAPVVTNDENLIFFCSRRAPGKKKNIDGLYYEDIFYAEKAKDGTGLWNKAAVIDKSSGYIQKEINDGKQHEAPISMSADGKTLFIYKENSIWKSELDENGKWSIPRRMNQNVNIGDANPSVFMTEDESEMFIVSVGVEGGYGDRDIYYTKKNEDGTWEKPENMGPKINTPYKDDAPFLSKDGKTLYFASQGHNSMGGFDIFKTVRDENGEWSDPINIGAPINSSGDDIYYVENDEGTLAYYASMRPGSFGYLDLYTAEIGCKNIPTTDIKGYAIFAENHLPVSGTIRVTDKESGEEMGVYTIDPKTGKYNMVLPPERTYYLELVVNQSKYNEIRPHREEFTIPKQCEYYNLYQEISVDYLRDTTGQIYAQRATFKNAMFDIDKAVNEEFGPTDLSSTGTSPDMTTGISGHIVHNGTLNAQFVEVILMNENHQVLRITETDENGDFAFEKLDPGLNYLLMINEDDAKISFLGENISSNTEVNLEGIIYTFHNKANTPRAQVTIYVADSDHEIANKTSSDMKGKFAFSNVASNPDEITAINNSVDVSYNLDVTNVEIVYSAYITHIDPLNTELNYTEYVDIIELKDYVDTAGGDMAGDQFWKILFDFDKYFLRQKSQDVLESVYQFMQDNPTVNLRLEGHTDWFGSEPYNDKLSERRALSAHKYLINKGIAPNRIKNAWFGETQPDVPNSNADGSDSPENRQLNRRVEIKVEVPEMADLYLSL